MGGTPKICVKTKFDQLENDKNDESAVDILRQGLGWLVIHNRFGAAATLTPLY